MRISNIEPALVSSLQTRPRDYWAGKYVWYRFLQDKHENQRKGGGGIEKLMKTM